MRLLKNDDSDETDPRYFSDYNDFVFLFVCLYVLTWWCVVRPMKNNMRFTLYMYAITITSHK